MGIRLLATVLGLVTALAAQDEPAPNPRPLQAVQAAPVAAPRSEGLVVDVVSEKGRPVAGALVGVLPPTWSAEQAAIVAALDRQYADEPNQRLAELLLRFGERFRCDENGRAVVPADARHLAAVHGVLAGELELAAPASGGVRLCLLRPVAVFVRAIGPDGRPVAGQQFRSAEGRFLDGAGAITDARGEAVLSLRPGTGRRDVAVVAAIAGASVRSALPAGPLPRTPIELRLPPTGVLRVIAYDDREQPRSDVESVAVGWDGEPWPVWARPDAKGDVLVRAALGVTFRVDVTLRGTTGRVQATCAGPTRAGELVVCDVRATKGPPVLVFRVLDRDGAPVRDSGLRGQLGTARSGGWQELGVAADGRVRLTVQPGFAAERLVVRSRTPNQAPGVTEYRGAAIVPVPPVLRPGDNELPDVRLGEEPVVVRGVVVDDAGVPLPGILVGVQLVFDAKEPYFGDVEPLRSDADGRYEGRDIRDAPTVRVMTRELPAGYEHAMVEAPRGAKDVQLVVARQGRVHLRFDGVPTTQHRLLFASLVPAGAVAAGSDLQFTDGSAWLRKPAGRYDLVLSLRRDELEIARIPDVVVRRGEATEDARLVPFPWRDHLTMVTITAVDEASAPVAGVMVWCLFTTPGGGEAGGGGLTDEQGRFVALVPKAGARFRLESEVRSDGPQYRSVDLPKCTTDQRVVLRAALHARVQLLGERGVPGAASVHWSLRSRGVGFPAAMVRMGGARQQPAADGTWELHFDAPGSHDIVLGVGVPDDDGRIVTTSLTWGTIEVKETGEVQTFRLTPDEATADQLDELRKRLRK